MVGLIAKQYVKYLEICRAIPPFGDNPGTLVPMGAHIAVARPI